MSSIQDHRLAANKISLGMQSLDAAIQIMGKPKTAHNLGLVNGLIYARHILRGGQGDPPYISYDEMVDEADAIRFRLRAVLDAWEETMLHPADNQSAISGKQFYGEILSALAGEPEECLSTLI